MDMPPRLRTVVDTTISEAREAFENGNMTPVCFMGKRAPPPDDDKFEGLIVPFGHIKDVDFIADALRTSARVFNAEWCLIVTEARMLEVEGSSEENLRDKFDRLMVQHGDISKTPGTKNIVQMSLETTEGYWSGFAEIDKKNKTFGEINFEFITEGRGRFVGLLPQPKSN